MPLIETRGAGSAQGFGEFAQSGPVNYIEDVFSCFLYTGNGSTQTITNGIDLLGKGGLVWIKGRSLGYSHYLANTNRGASKYLATNRSDAENYNGNYTDTLTSFNSNGFSLGADSLGSVNTSGDTYTSWTFRKQKKFFDVVTYTGNGSDQNIPHNLGSVPGFVVVKRTSSSGEWSCWHRSIPTQYILLNSANAATGSITRSVTSTTYQIFGSFPDEGSNGATYVMYLFAHNAGGFGVTGADNVISCGSYSGTGGAGNVISLGYEPQFVIIKKSTNVSAAVSDWLIVDNMRGWPARGSTTDRELFPNLSNAENFNYGVKLNSTGFELSDSTINGSGETYIYIAIRRGPMKTPTSGTSVYEGTAYTGNAASNRQIGSSVLTDLLLLDSRDATAFNWSTYAQYIFDRLRGQDVSLSTANTNAEVGGWSTYFNLDMNAGWDTGTTASQDYLNKSGSTYVSHAFRRAPGFFDVVCYTGTGSATTFSHNLGVAPELVIVKWRSGATGEDWPTMCTAASSSPDKRLLYLDLTAAGGGLNGVFANSSGTPVLPTSTQVYIGTNDAVNKSAATYVAYLFATLAGVSKVGTYTGTGTTKQIDCGFTGGARFVLIKRTDSTGDWYVWDTARGIVSGNDPYLLLNSTAAEVTNTDYVDTYSAGFELSSTAPAALNANGGTYIFLAIA